jgi:UDP-N-acetylmuramoylalanine--D-glutamate ligase
MPRPGQSVVSFSLESNDADYTLARSPAPMIVRRGEPLLPLAAMRLQGLHNAANAMAALALAEALDLPLAPALDALCAFGGLPHRSQWVADVRGVRYVNDSKGTNVGATLAAVRGLAGPLVVIAGGDGKNQDFSELRQAFRGKVRHVVLIGRDAPALAATLADVCATERASDMPAAVRAAQAVAQPGDIVLLSPACASLDMFRDYSHRGDEFAAAVRSLAA